MKKIYMISKFAILLIFPLISFFGCKNEIDDIFDKDPLQRLEEAATECNNILVGSEYGWKFAYEPNSGECYRFLMTFSDTSYVTMTSDMTESTMIKPVTSYYEFNYSQGPVLSFALYGMISNLVDPQQGHGGDNEFVLMKTTQDSIVLTGRNNLNRVVLYKATKEDAENYYVNNSRLKSLLYNKSQSSAFFNVINMSNGTGLVLTTETNSHYLTFYSQDASGETVKSRVPYDFNGHGFNTNIKIDAKGNFISDFTWDDVNNTFYVTDDPAAKIEFAHFPPIKLDNTIDYYKGKTLIFKNGSNTINSYIRNIKSSNSGYTGLQFFWDNTILGKNALSIVITSTSGDNNNYFDLTENGTNVIREDQASFNNAETFSGANANKLSKNLYVKRLLEAFFDAAGFTVYKENDNIYFVSISNSTNWFCFTIEE